MGSLNTCGGVFSKRRLVGKVMKGHVGDGKVMKHRLTERVVVTNSVWLIMTSMERMVGKTIKKKK